MTDILHPKFSLRGPDIKAVVFNLFSWPVRETTKVTQNLIPDNYKSSHDYSQF